jgi:DNA-directed RNA polymerase II subunit RPB2
LKHSEKGYID